MNKKKEQMENFELSLNQKRSWFLDGKNMHNLYHLLAIRFLEPPDSKKIIELLYDVVQTHETLSSAIFLEENTNVPLQTPGYFTEIKCTLLSIEEFNQWMAEASQKSEPTSQSSQPISFYIFVDASQKVEKLVLKAQSFWTDLFGCFKILENIQRKLNGETLLNKSEEEFIEHKNFAAWQNELIQEKDSEGILFWSKYKFDLTRKNIPFGTQSALGFRPKKLKIGEILIKEMEAEVHENLELEFLLAYAQYVNIYQSSNFTLGYTLFSRLYEELNETVGLVAKTVPLELTSEMLEAGRESKMQLAERLEEIRDWSDYYGADYLDKNFSLQSFQTIFQFVNLREVLSDDDNFVVESLFSTQDTFELKLAITTFSEHIEIDVYYDENVFNNVQIDVIKSQLINVLATRFNLSLEGELSTVVPQILKQLEGEGSPDIDPKMRVHYLIDEQITNNPTSLALSKGSEEITYAELGRRVEIFAHSLVEQFNELSERPVAILLEDPIEYVISMLGILKAGGHFLPLEPKTPSNRLNFILQDSNSVALITSQSIDSSIHFSGEILEYKTLTEASYVKNEFVLNESGVAYIIYTSGSTGKPKGVKVGHASLLNYLNWAKSYYPIGNAALFTSFSFDLTLTSILLPLVNGKAVYAPDDNTSIDETLIEILRNPFIQLIKLTPSHINLIAILSAKANGEKAFICGGEALTLEQIRTLHDLGTDIQVYNEYGPTEATIGCVVANISRSDLRILIGSPIDNVRLKVQNGNTSCTVGQLGELWIGGKCLSLGYINPSEESAAAFTTIGTAFDRFYKTGDLVRLLPSGELEYFGRIDDQVKINGYRIELGEIESELIQIEGVTNAAVLCQKDESSNPMLLAFFEAGNQLEVSMVKAFLSENLPQYMIPKHFYQLERMPLTSNGKLDRKKLLEMKTAELSFAVEHVPARTIEEQQLVNIWAEVLKISPERIGIKHRFFEIGGDSIKVIRMVVELRKTLDYKLTLEDVYANDTIESLIEYVTEHSDEIGSEDEIRQELRMQIEREIEALKERVLSTNLLENDLIEDLYPMSDIEKGMVFGYLLNEGTGTYHDQMVFTNRFEDFSLERFEKALNTLSAKHEILRTGFDLSNFETEIQIVYKTINHSVRFEDISTLSLEMQEQSIREFLARQLAHRFDVESAPLWRMSMFKVGVDNYIFIFEFHHAMLDGWSDASFITELNNLYLMLAESPDYMPSQLKSSYKDFVIQQKISESSDDVKAFWKAELADYERLNLFTQEEEISKYVHSRGQDYLERIESRAAELKTTVKTFSLSAYLVLLQLLDSESEVVTGLVCNNRPNLPDGDKIIGCFLNTIPFKANIDSNIQLGEFIQQVHQKTIALKKYEGLSLFGITEACQEKSENANPFFDVMFNFVDFHVFNEVRHDENINQEVERTHGPAIESHERTNTYFDFTVSATGNEFGLLLSATNKLRSGLSIEYVGKLYFKIVDAILADPTLTSGELQILEAHEVVELTETMNNTEFVFESDVTIVDYFENIVLKQGKDVAIADENTSLTYEELNQKSNLLAHTLIGLFTEERLTDSKNVGVLLERSAESVIAMLGIMKAGASYVPLNHEHPSDRLNYIVSDAGLKVLIGEESLCKKHAIEVAHRIDLTTIYSSDSEHLAKDNPPKSNLLDDSAAIFYTSGSTGKPKGVLQTHRMMRNLIHWDVELSGIEKGLKHLQFNAFSFDACIQDVFFALCSGGSLYMVKESSRLDYHQLLTEIVSNEIQVLFLPFSALNAFSALVEIDQLKHHSIKYIISTAEQLILNESLKSFLTNNPEIELRNYYGPTETHIVTKHIMSAKLGNLESPSPVGNPIANSQIFLLNGSGNLIPKGVIGEIYIGGENLAAGYVNLPELTQEKFVMNPFRNRSKLYKTGDRGYWRQDNVLIFLGRKDDQVKIRGFRVELGEIEHTLSQNEHIEKAVVLAEKTSDNEHELVAYFQVKKADNIEITLENSELRTYLKQSLPDYMIPSYYVQMEMIPLTNNGKIDKKALQLPVDFGIANDQNFIHPQTDLQKKLVLIWEEVLNREQIGIRNDFFALGGHSLKVVRLNNKYQKELGVNISLKELFQKTTIEEQCDIILNEKRRVFKPIERVPQQKSYPISDAQRRLWVLSQFEDEAVSYNMPDRIYLDQNIDVDCFKKSILSTIARHEILRTVFKVDEEGEIKQWVLEPSELNFTIDYQDFRQSENAIHSDSGNSADVHQRIEEYINSDTYKPFDFENGPLIRAAILQVDDQSVVFYYNLHHIISDGLSGDVLARDVMNYYEFHVNPTEKSEPKELSIQYKDYSIWQLDQLKTEAFQKHREFWLNQLSGDLPIIDLPTSKKRPVLKTSNGRTIGTYLSEELCSKLKVFSQEQGGTLFTGLLTTLNAMLYRYTDQPDLIIGSPVAGREHPDLEDQIGFFVNTLALRNQVQPNDSFKELFCRIKENLFNAYAHQMYPFDRLVNELQLTRDTSRSVVFDIMLVHQNNLENDPENGNSIGHTGEIVDYGAKTSKFDLLITTKEVGGQLSLLFEYNSDVYDGEMMERFIVHFVSFIQQLVELPDQSISTIDYLNRSEREKLILGLNQTAFDYGENLVMNLFEQQVEKTPKKIAVVQGEKSLTYDELNKISNRLAHELRKNYLQSTSNSQQVHDVKIGVMLDRSINSIISMIGVMKAGAVYVPLSRKYPEERIKFIVDDAALSVVICDEESTGEHSFENSMNLYEAVKNRDDSNPKNLSQSHDAAFIIYTSGSTGNPKGVIQSHSMMRNLTSWDLSNSGIDRDLKHLHYNDFGFDVSIQDCWSPLCAGGTVYITMEADKVDFKSIWNTIVEHEIEVLSFPFSALHQLILQNENQDYSKLMVRHIISAGEQLIVNTPLHQFLENNPTVKLHNHYGPSESHVVTYHSMCGELQNIVHYAPIGKPIANTQIYILDRNGDVVPQGVKGELYIGGDNLSLGYVNLPEETKERFVDHPFAPQKKLYRTGDQAVWNMDGNIMFLGRNDDQVKIRGYRVELQEVERVLKLSPAIKDAAIIVNQTEKGDVEMVAYIKTNDSLKLDQLRSFLMQKIPNHMIPTHFIEVDAFQLTVNGKVDKRALKNRVGKELASGVIYVPPTSETEKQLVEIWEDVLQRKNIGICDDFFMLGGHSIKAAKVVSKINQVFKSGMKIGHIFSTPTITDLAYNIEFALNQRDRKSRIQNIKEIEL